MVDSATHSLFVAVEPSAAEVLPESLKLRLFLLHLPLLTQQLQIIFKLVFPYLGQEGRPGAWLVTEYKSTQGKLKANIKNQEPKNVYYTPIIVD